MELCKTRSRVRRETPMMQSDGWLVWGMGAQNNKNDAEQERVRLFATNEHEGVLSHTRRSVFMNAHGPQAENGDTTSVKWKLHDVFLDYVHVWSSTCFCTCMCLCVWCACLYEGDRVCARVGACVPPQRGGIPNCKAGRSWKWRILSVLSVLFFGRFLGRYAREFCFRTLIYCTLLSAKTNSLSN